MNASQSNKATLLSIVLSSAVSLGAFTSNVVHAADTMAGEIKEAAKDVKQGVKEAARAADDKACPLVHGKPHCAVKKGVHKVKNGAEAVQDKMND